MVDSRITLVTGKGGVGKSSVAASLALAARDRWGEATLIEFEGASSSARMLPAGDGIHCLTVNYFDALALTVSEMLRSRILGRVVVGQDTLKRVLAAVPAIRELVALDAVRRAADEGGAVVVDLPATGHAVDWLRVPAAALRFLGQGPAYQMCARIQERIIAPGVSDIVVVSTCETVVASETRELCQRLRQELGRPPSAVVANRVPRRPAPAELEVVAERAQHDQRFAALRRHLRFDMEAAEEADHALDELATTAGARLLRIPELHADPTPGELLRYLAPGTEAPAAGAS